MANTSCVMLIDNDDINNYISKNIIRRVNLCQELLTFPDGESSLEYLLEKLKEGENSPELIFLDIHLSGMNGFDFIKKFKELPFKNKDKVFLIGLTSTSYPENIEKLLDYGCQFVFEKPLTKSHVQFLVNQIQIQREKI